VPDLGDFNDVEVVEILVKEGDQIKVDGPIITVETDKAAMDIPSPFPGKIVEMYFQKGDKINQGDDLCEIEVSQSFETEDELNEIEENTVQEVETQKQADPKQQEPDTFESEIPTELLNKSFAGVHASPSVRKLARELGVDLNQVPGTGLKNRIQPEDLKSHVKAIITRTSTTQQPSLPEVPHVDHAKYGPIKSVPLSRIKKISGPRLQASWINIPHVTQHDEIDINEVEQVRIDMKNQANKEGLSLTILAFVIKAVCKVLKSFPNFNSSLDLDGKSLIHKEYIHIGFATNTEKGLMVPVIKHADQKDLLSVAKELKDLSELARNGKILLEDLQGGTFTISSLGSFGGTAFTPIINAPEVAILGVARSQIRPVFVKGQFLPRLMLPVSISYDHRVIDGVEGIQFTTELKNTLEHPSSFLDSADTADD